MTLKFNITLTASDDENNIDYECSWQNREFDSLFYGLADGVFLDEIRDKLREFKYDYVAKMSASFMNEMDENNIPVPKFYVGQKVLVRGEGEFELRALTTKIKEIVIREDGVYYFTDSFRSMSGGGFRDYDLIPVSKELPCKIQ